MPLYEYECASCRKRFELRQKITEDALSVCPSCGGIVRRIIHPVGIIFKGSGFYVTDNRKSEASSASNGSGDAPAGKKDSDGSKAESEAKSETGTKAESDSKSDSKSDSGTKSDSGSTAAKVPSGSSGSSSSNSGSKSGAGKEAASS